MWDLALNKSEIWPSFTPIIVYFIVLAQSRSWVKDTADQKNEERGLGGQATLEVLPLKMDVWT